MSAHFTVLGGGGFIGGRLVKFLRDAGAAVEAPPRLPAEAYLGQLRARPLGHVVYCVGLTADFREKPFETVEAHVGVVGRVLAQCDFDSLTYVSSTRVYIRSSATNEAAPLNVDPGVPEDLFNLSKLLGESLCLAGGRTCRIARLSNVFGESDASQNFLTSVLRDAARGKVRIGLSPESTKDYVDIDDVVNWLAKIATSGTQAIYNLASGGNTSNGKIAAALGALGVEVEFEPNGKTIAFPPIDVDRVTREFGKPRGHVVARIPELLAAAKRRI
jgi:nucleoside-diphosphate-sugar epimerase